MPDAAPVGADLVRDNSIQPVGWVKEQSDVPNSFLNKAVCWVRDALPNLQKLLHHLKIEKPAVTDFS
jgi:hypothetical protein